MKRTHQQPHPTLVHHAPPLSSTIHHIPPLSSAIHHIPLCLHWRGLAWDMKADVDHGIRDLQIQQGFACRQHFEMIFFIYYYFKIVFNHVCALFCIFLSIVFFDILNKNQERLWKNMERSVSFCCFFQKRM